MVKLYSMRQLSVVLLLLLVCQALFLLSLYLFEQGALSALAVVLPGALAAIVTMILDSLIVLRFPPRNVDRMSLKKYLTHHAVTILLCIETLVFPRESMRSGLALLATYLLLGATFTRLHRLVALGLRRSARPGLRRQLTGCATRSLAAAARLCNRLDIAAVGGWAIAAGLLVGPWFVIAICSLPLLVLLWLRSHLA